MLKFSEITPQFLRDNYLFGIPLEDMYGNKMKDSMLQHYINSAIQYTQRMLQIQIEPTNVVNEVHDYYDSDFNNWSYLQVYKRPIISVQSMNMFLADQLMFNIPTAWIQPYPITGQLQIFPTSGTTGNIILTNDGSFLPMITGMWKYAPSMWQITYQAGFEDVPEDIIEFVMKRASIGVLQVWGDLIIGAGIANETISIDGLSQSIGTTQSPEFTGAGARIKNYQDDMKELKQHLFNNYVGVNLGIL